MKILVIYAHPATSGHCSLILEEVTRSLENKKLSYEVLDLYKMSYDPILHEREHFTSGNREISLENQQIQEKIKNSDWLIFIYPVWWGTMPAILKGFFDRILTPRFAYKYEGKIPQKLLVGKRALVFMTSGSPKLYLWLMGNRPKRNIKKDILNFCGIKANVFQLGNCRKMTEDKKEKIKEMVKKGMRKIG